MKNKINNITLYLLILFTIYSTLIIGISWDELIHIERGNERLKYLFSFGAYSYLDYGDQKFYPGFYNTLATLITKMFPKKLEISTLHLVNSLFSILTIFGISKISSELFNKQVGKIVFLLCFFNPTFFGHIAINQKDMIIAFSNVWATYFIFKYLKKQHIDEKRNKYSILVGLTFGLGLGVRIVFLSTIIPVIIFSILDVLFFKKIANKKFSNKKMIIDVFKIFIIAYTIMISCWPDTHKNIFIMPIILFIESFNEIIGIPLALINGNIYNTAETPKLYLLINLFYKLPEAILVCYLVFVFLFLINNKFYKAQFEFFNTKILFLLFIIIFPNLLIFVSPYKIYDGLRLFMYLIPYICIIPALTIYFLIKNYKIFYFKILSILVFTSFAYYLFIFFSLTPYQYTYLNFLNGDFSKTYKKFENDYWAVSLKELIEKIPDNKNLLNNDDLKLAFCGAADVNAKYYLKKIKNFKFKQVNWLTENYDYIIMTNRVVIDQENIYDLENAKTCFEKFKGTDVVTVKRNGLILSTIRKKI